MLVAAIISLLAMALVAALLYGSASAAEERAVSGATAVAHGVAVAANAMDERDDLSIRAQSGRDCVAGKARPKDYVTDKDQDELCDPLIKAANDLAADNGVRLVSLVIGPSIREQGGPPAPGHLDVLAVVEATGPLAGEWFCDGDNRVTGWCSPQAAMGAEVVA